MAIISTEDLKTVIGKKRPGDIEKHLQKEGVRYFSGRHGSWTTEALLNTSKGLVSTLPDSNDPIL